MTGRRSGRSRSGSSGLSTWVLAKLFGAGPVGEVAARGVTFLGHELREALSKDDQHLSRVQLKPGERYTVVARPRPTRRERKLAKKQDGLVKTFKKETSPSKSQKRAARKLKRAQKRLDKVAPDSRRYEKRAAKERRRGLEFDRRMRPSRKQIRTAEELDRVSKELDLLRAQHLEHARRANRPRRSVKIYG